MSRNLSPSTLEALNAQESGEVFIALITLEHEALTEPIRVNTSGASLIVGDVEYIDLPVTIVLPDEAPDRPPRSKLSIDNVDQRIGVAVRQINTAPTVHISIVTASDPETVDVAFPDFKLTNVTTTRPTVEGDLTLEEFTDEPYPAATFTRSRFPGVM